MGYKSNAAGYSEFDAINEGTPQAMKDAGHGSGGYYYDEDTQIRRQVTESPFNSPFQIHGGRSRLATTMNDERAGYLGHEHEMMVNHNPPVANQVPALDT